MNITVIDFETEAIDKPTSFQPPEPVGLAIRLASGITHYYAWGHPTNNNCKLVDAKKALARVWNSQGLVGFHNAAFDLSVTQTWFGLSWLPWHRIHDSLLLAYLYEPGAETLSLKPTAERLLNIKPDEQTVLHQWLIDNGHVTKNEKNWGARIAKAPGDIVGNYAIGDVHRTYALIEKLHPEIVRLNMAAAYDRERQLLIHVHNMTKRGVAVDADALDQDAAIYSLQLTTVDDDIRKLLNEPTLNVDANDNLAAALEREGKIKEWGYTPKGKKKIARDSLLKGLNDPALAHVLAYRGVLSTMVGTFLGPWTKFVHNGRIHAAWDQIRGPDGGGTRTGRFASHDPNLTNVPNMPMKPPDGYPPLPNMRDYVLPEDGHIFVAADYSGQELRMLAHFAEGRLAEWYRNDPNVDVHSAVQNMVQQHFGINAERKTIKAVIFSLIYGAGVPSISAKLGLTQHEGYRLIRAVLDTLAGVLDFKTDVQGLGDRGETVRTWGGRLLQAPLAEDGRRKGYALVNYLIQGSSADQTKQAILDYEGSKQSGQLLLTVHDEICISVPVGDQAEIARLKAAMEAGQFDVPVRAEIHTGSTWGGCKQ